MERLTEENLKEFGKHVRKIRQRNSSSLNEVAFKRGGVTSATLSRIENGLVDFKFSTLLNLTQTLDVSLLELLDGYVFKSDSDK